MPADSANWVSDNTNFLVSTTLGLVSFVAAVYFYMRSRRSRTLDWRVLSDQAIVATTAARAVNLEMLWAGRRVTHPRLLVVEILNTGTDAILARNVEQSVKVVVRGGEVLSADVIERPEGSTFAAVQTRDGFTLSPGLLNSKESIKIQLLLDAEEAALEVNARIADLARPIANLVERRGSRDSILAPLYVAFLAISFATCFALNSFAVFDARRGVSLLVILNFFVFIFASMAAILGVRMAFLAAWSQRRSRRP